MRRSAITAGLCGAMLLCAPWPAHAAGDHAATSLAPADAAGPWTLASGGRPICVLNLNKEKISAAGFALTVPLACGDALPNNLVAWAPSANGVSLIGLVDGSVMGFSRVSDGRLVSHRPGGEDLELQRGGPNPSASPVSLRR